MGLEIEGNCVLPEIEEAWHVELQLDIIWSHAILAI